MTQQRDRAALVGVVLVLGLYGVLRSAVIPDDAHFITNTLMIAVLAVVAASTGLTAAELGLGRDRAADGLRLGAAAALVVAAVLAVGAATGIADSFTDDTAGLSGGEVLVRALVEIPIATVVLEELAFRGVIAALLARLLGVGRALLLTAALFAVWHVPPLWDGWSVDTITSIGGTLAFTFAAGVLFQVMRNRSGSLLAPILAHWATNAMALVMVWWLASS